MIFGLEIAKPNVSDVNNDEKYEDYQAGLYIIFIIMFYCVGGVLLICTGMKKKHKHRLGEDEQVESYISQRRLIEKQAKVDQIWHTDRFLRQIFIENSSHDMINDIHDKEKINQLNDLKELILKSPKNVFSIPSKPSPCFNHSKSCT